MRFYTSFGGELRKVNYFKKEKLTLDNCAVIYIIVKQLDADH